MASGRPPLEPSAALLMALQARPRRGWGPDMPVLTRAGTPCLLKPDGEAGASREQALRDEDQISLQGSAGGPSPAEN